MIGEALLSRILDQLKPGEIVSSDKLMSETGLGQRELRQAVHTLRLRGHLICSRTSCGGGYWLAETAEAAKPFVESMSRRGRSVFAAVSPARRFVKQQGEDGR